ncbi:MAG: LLM class flavin-dependent oxidoreductase, partial [Acidimicrobiales bacterium]|nr:LLM class flavin-dependent oxidoreductase [Acidimicrobiales bacterium]
MADLVIDGATTASTPNGCAAEAAAFEELQLNAAWTFEASHDPFLPLALAGEQTQSIELGTAIAVAFARNPMTCAITAWDLQRLSNGRFILGLGTQIKPHITKRY